MNVKGVFKIAWFSAAWSGAVVAVLSGAVVVARSGTRGPVVTENLSAPKGRRKGVGGAGKDSGAGGGTRKDSRTSGRLRSRLVGEGV